jgi:5'-deoxynucleotidase YfbR-like HD superfamily hydrolase
LEAQIVKAADVIDLLVQALALERGGARGLNEFWEVAEADHLPLEGTPREVFNQLISELKEARRTLPR